jgi:thiamine transport system substrate-binding protein
MRKNKRSALILASALCLVLIMLADCSSKPRALKVLTHDSFSASKSVIEAFEKANNIRIEFIKGGDAGETLNKAILSKGNPLADVLYGADNTFAGRALDADILEPYDSPSLSGIPSSLRIDPSNRLLPVDYAYVCLVYDTTYFSSRKLPVPRGLEDLALPVYKNLLVVENPAVSSPGLAFLLATVGHFSASGGPAWQDFWRRLKDNGVRVVNGWNDAYYTEFSASGKGRRPIVTSYATDPAADVYFASDPKPALPRVGAIYADQTAFLQIEFVGILKGTKEKKAARKFVDFMLSADFQQDIPLQMWVYPALKDAKLPELFLKFAPAPSAPVVMDPKQIADRRDRLIAEWARIVLQ